jgi:hypothetical protein
VHHFWNVVIAIQIRSTVEEIRDIWWIAWVRSDLSPVFSCSLWYPRIRETRDTWHDLSKFCLSLLSCFRAWSNWGYLCDLVLAAFDRKIVIICDLEACDTRAHRLITSIWFSWYLLNNSLWCYLHISSCTAIKIYHLMVQRDHRSF